MSRSCELRWSLVVVALMADHTFLSTTQAQDAAADLARRPKLIVQVGHRTEVTAMAVSPDGKFIATGDADGRIFVWDSASGKELRELKLPMPESAVDTSGQHWAQIEGTAIWSLDFSPDGTYIGATAVGLNLCLWETNTGKLVSRVDDELGVPWNFTVDMRQLVAGSQRLTHNSEDATFTDPRPLIERGIGSENRVLTQFVGQKWTAEGDATGQIVVYDSTMFELTQRFQLNDQGTLVELGADDSDRPERGEAVIALAKGRNDNSLLVGGRCGSVVHWEVPTRQVLWNIALRDPVEHIVASSDGQWIIVRTAHHFHLLAAGTGASVQRVDTNRAALCGAFAADGSSVLTGHGDRVLRLWDARTGKVLRRFEGAFGGIVECAYVDRGQSLAAFDSYGILSVWNAASGALLRQLDVPEALESSADEPPDGPAASPVLKALDALQDFRGGERYGLGLESYRRSSVRSWQYAGSPEAKFCKQGKTLVLFGRSGSFAKGSIDVTTGQRLPLPQNEDFRPTNLLAVSADGRFVVADKMGEPSPDSGAYNSEYWVAALSTGKYIGKIADNGYFAGPTTAAISPDNVWVAIDDGGTNVRIVGASNGRIYTTIDTQNVATLTFSPRSTHLAFSGVDGLAQLWDRATGKLSQALVGHSSDVTSMAFSPDGRLVLTTSADETARLWNVATGQPVFVLTEPNPTVAGMEFTANGGLLLAHNAGDIVIHESPNGPVEHRLRGVGANEQIVSVCLNPGQGQLIVNARRRQHRSLLGPRLTIQPLAKNSLPVVMQDGSKSATTYGQIATFAPAGSQIIALSGSGVVRNWNEQGLASRHHLEGSSNFDRDTMLEISDDRRSVAAVQGFTAGDSCRIWEIASGKLVAQDAQSLEFFDFAPDLDVFFRMKEDGLGFELVDQKTKRVLKDFPDVQSADLSFDGSRFVTSHSDGIVRVWETATLNEQLQFQYTKGKQATERDKNYKGDPLTGLLQLLIGVSKLLDDKEEEAPPDKAQEMPEAPASDEPERPLVAQQVRFSPTARYIVTWEGQTHKIWDAATGAEQCELAWPHIEPEPGEEDAANQAKLQISNVEFSPDERWLVGAPGPYLSVVPQHGFLVVWDAMTGDAVRVIRSPASPSLSPMFSEDSRLILMSGADDAIYLWHRESGVLACQLVMIDDENWAAVDAEGRFDASRGGDAEGMHWVIGNETVALAQLKERYYEPGLLAKVLGLNPEPLRDVNAFQNVNLFPDVQLTGMTPDNPKLGVRLTNRGGGIGRVVIRINGKELTADARGEMFPANAQQVELPPLDLARDPRLIPGQKNVIEVQAFNAEGYLSSRGLELEFTPEPDANQAPTQLWAIIAGVSDYRGDSIDLHYAAKDARDFSQALQIGARQLYQPENVHITTLSGSQSEGKQRATRQNLIEALTAARSARSADILVIYLSGHGVNHGGQDGDFYYLTSDAHTADLADDELRKQIAMSSTELTDLINQIPANKQVFILDTCASGRLVEKLTQRRDVPSSQTRALQRVKDRTGTFLLAGCAADRVSYETSRYAQGLLTYSLLFGMRGPALTEGQYVDVSTLFNFAHDEVPKLAIDVGGLQQPTLASPKAGGSFYIGQFLSEDKLQIPLQTIRPLVLRANFQDEERLRDQLNLSKQVNDLLREVSARGREAEVVFVDAEEFPGAFDVVGRYRQRAGKLSVTVLVSQGEMEVARFEITGNVNGLKELAVQIIEKTQAQLRDVKPPESPPRKT